MLQTTSKHQAICTGSGWGGFHGFHGVLMVRSTAGRPEIHVVVHLSGELGGWGVAGTRTGDGFFGHVWLPEAACLWSLCYNQKMELSRNLFLGLRSKVSSLFFLRIRRSVQKSFQWISVVLQPAFNWVIRSTISKNALRIHQLKLHPHHGEKNPAF